MFMLEKPRDLNSANSVFTEFKSHFTYMRYILDKN